jgi:hypothetical protein
MHYRVTVMYSKLLCAAVLSTPSRKNRVPGTPVLWRNGWEESDSVMYTHPDSASGLVKIISGIAVLGDEGVALGSF